MSEVKSSSQSEDLIEVSEVAKLLGVSYETALLYVKAGRIPSYQYDKRGRIRVHRADVLKFREAHRVESPEDAARAQVRKTNEVEP